MGDSALESEPESVPNFTNLDPELEWESCNYLKVESELESESDCQGGIGFVVGAGNCPSFILTPSNGAFISR